LPALIIPATKDRPEQKTHSSMVAYGRVMQPWRVEWKGAKIEIPAEHHEDFLRRVWT